MGRAQGLTRKGLLNPVAAPFLGQVDVKFPGEHVQTLKEHLGRIPADGAIRRVADYLGLGFDDGKGIGPGLE